MCPSTNECGEKTAKRRGGERQMTREQFSLAYDNGYRLTVRFLVSRGLSGENAEEAAQAAWAKGWEHRNNLRNPKRVVSWVNTIALNLFRNWFRRRESPEDLPEIPITPRIDPRAIDLHRTLETCEARDRQLLEKHYLEGYSSEELAKRTGCTAVAVRVRLLRVRRKLDAMLRPEREVRNRPRQGQQGRLRTPLKAHARAVKAQRARSSPADGMRAAA
jgi:RNA polymerase sigma factor (sigma-70 family)